MITLSRVELTAQWRLRRHLEPQRADITVIYDGAGMERLEAEELNDWWDNLLETAPNDWLHQEDLTSVVETELRDDGGMEITFPERVRLKRLTEIELSSWKGPVSFIDPLSYEMEKEKNPYIKHGVHSPIAVVYPGKRYVIYPVTRNDIKRIMGICDSDGETYTFDSRCLSTIEGGASS